LEHLSVLFLMAGSCSFWWYRYWSYPRIY